MGGGTLRTKSVHQNLGETTMSTDKLDPSKKQEHPAPAAQKISKDELSEKELNKATGGTTVDAQLWVSMRTHTAAVSP
jgi:hypothetical protein